MKLSDFLSIADNPHHKQHSYGNDFFVDHNFRYIDIASSITKKHIVISGDRHVYNNTLNLPFDSTNTILAYPDELDEAVVYYMLGLIIANKKQLSFGVRYLMELNFPDLPATLTSTQLRIIYAAKELTRLVAEIHSLKADFYNLYHSIMPHHKLDEYTHLSNIKLHEIITEGRIGEDIHFEQSGLLQSIDARDKVHLSKFRVHNPIEKQYLLLLSAIHNNVSYFTHIHTHDEMESIMNQLSEKHKILNISLQRRVESFLDKQIGNLVIQLSNE